MRSTSSRSTSGTRSSTTSKPDPRSEPEGELREGRARRPDVYNFAANMGGMGFIENNKALCMLSVLINTHMLQAAQKYGVERFFYSSSACVYNGDKQTRCRHIPA